jgi:hypothetical protein
VAARVIASKAAPAKLADAVKVADSKPVTVFAGKSSLGGPPASSAGGPAAKPSATKAAAGGQRPGFKLSCTSAQKLDEVKQRCVPLKGAKTVAAKKS